MGTIDEDLKIPPYVAYVRTRTPSWLSGYWGMALVDSIASTLDVVFTGAASAIGTRFIRLKTVDALDYFGADHLMPRSVNEGHTAYRSRLSNARLYWSNAGTLQGMTSWFEGMGFTVTISEGIGGKWFNFGVTIEQPFPTGFLTSTWNWNNPATSNWGGSRNWGGIDKTMIDLVRQIITTMKPAYAINTSLIVDSGTYTIVLPPEK